MSINIFPTRVGDTLNKMTIYELCRDYRSIKIEIRFGLVGPEAGKYSATPIVKDDYASDQLWGYGDTEQAALRDCLTKIQHLSAPEMESHP